MSSNGHVSGSETEHRWSNRVGNLTVVSFSKECAVLGWALVFFVLALAAAAFGFGGLAGTAASIAQILFVIFLALTILAFVVRAVQGRSVL